MNKNKIEKLLKYIEKLQNQLVSTVPQKYAHLPERIANMKRFILNDIADTKAKIAKLKLGE
jgi:hypothetical protein